MWNEIKHESEKQIHRKACAHFSYLPYLLNVMLLLVLLPAPLASASPTFNVNPCGAKVGKIKLRQDVRLYINPTSLVTIVKFTSNCGQDYKVTIKKTDIQTDDHMRDSSGRLWAIVSYRVDHDVIHLKLGGHIYPYQNKNNCSSPDPLKVAFTRGEADVALDCSVIQPYQQTYHYRSHIIFIPIGAIFFLLSVCCRCFYKRKNRRQPIAVSVSANPIIRPVPSQPNPVPPTMPPTHLPTPHVTPSQLPPPPYSQLPPSNLPPYSQLTPSQLPPSNLPPYSQLTPSQLPPSNLPPYSQLTPSNLPPSQLPPSNLPPYSQLQPSTVDSELPPPTSSKDKIFSKFKNQFAFKRLENDSA